MFNEIEVHMEEYGYDSQESRHTASAIFVCLIFLG
jgi:hypothetical protein